MSEGDPDPPDLPGLTRGSPLSRRYAESCRFARLSLRCAPPPTLVFSHYRGIRMPTLSLMGYQNLGPARHAVSQRTVAGIRDIIVLPPKPMKKRE